MATRQAPSRIAAGRRGRAVRGRNGRRGGNALIEMAVVLPVLTAVGMGMAEFGQYMYLRHAFDLAARDAARFGIPNTAQQGDPAAAATLAQFGVTYQPSMMQIYDPSNWWAGVSDVSTIPTGHFLYVSVSATYGSLPNAYRPLSRFCGVGIGSGKQVQGQCTMIKE